MGTFLSYSLESGLLMLAMFLAYRVFLARENQHNYNRGVLLMIYIVSFAYLPLISLVHLLVSSTPSQESVFEGLGFIGVKSCTESQPIWGTVLIWAFMAGMAVVTAKTVITWIRLLKMIRSGDKVTHGEYTLVLTDDDKFAPFSWMRYILISRADYTSNCRAITTHELKHVACHHWVDLLIAQIVCIINWFNPAAWLMRDELMLVHEYQADMAVIDSGHNPQEYQMLLIKKAVGTRFPSLANSLNHSKLKKRITMMYKEKSGAGRKFKALALVPMLALALLVAGVPAVRAAVSTISNSGVSVSEGNENTANVQASATNDDDTEIGVYDTADVMPQYPGGETAMMNAVMGKLTFPDPGRNWKAEASGRALIGFTVNADGTIGDIRRIESCGYGDLDQIAIDAVKNGLTERWAPGSVGGNPVAVSFVIPIQFKQKAE